MSFTINDHPPRYVECGWCGQQSAYIMSMRTKGNHQAAAYGYLWDPAQVALEDVYRHSILRPQVPYNYSLEVEYTLPSKWLHIDERFMCPTCVLKTVKEHVKMMEEQGHEHE